MSAMQILCDGILNNDCTGFFLIFYLYIRMYSKLGGNSQLMMADQLITLVACGLLMSALTTYLTIMKYWEVSCSQLLISRSYQQFSLLSATQFLMCSFGKFVLDQFNNPPIDIFFSVTHSLELEGSEAHLPFTLSLCKETMLSL